MIQTKRFEIKGSDDFELGIARQNPLEFFLTFDDEKDIEASVFILHGMGADASPGYSEHLADFLAANYPVAACGINYFGIGSRPNAGAKIAMSQADLNMWKLILKNINLDLDERSLNIACHEPIAVARGIADEIAAMINEGRRDPRYQVVLPLTCFYSKNEYENWGVMAAIDAANVAIFLEKNQPFPSSKWAAGGGVPVILCGSSHGGYIAMMSAKIAPQKFFAVVESSGYIRGDERLIGLGRYRNYAGEPCFNFALNNWLYINGFVTSQWHIFDGPGQYTASRAQIRDLRNAQHLKQISKIAPIFHSYHSSKDLEIAPVSEKIELFEKLSELGISSNLKIVKRADGKFIKDLTHGMGISYKMLLNKELPGLLKKINSPKFEKIHRKNKVKFSQENPLKFETDEFDYCFFESGDEYKLECRERK